MKFNLSWITVVTVCLASHVAFAQHIPGQPNPPAVPVNPPGHIPGQPNPPAVPVNPPGHIPGQPNPPAIPVPPPFFPPSSSAGFTCLTSSHSLPFSAQAFDPSSAQIAAVNACQANASTSNQECAQNVRCQPSTQPFEGAVACTTQSHSLPFNLSGQDELTTQAQVIRLCEANSSTANSECFANAVCQIQPALPPSAAFSCMSESKGLVFTATQQDQFGASNAAIRACQANASTSNDECAGSVQCEFADTSGASNFSCSTQSQFLQFAGQSAIRFEALAQAVRSCQSNASTSNVECRQNVNCQQF